MYSFQSGVHHLRPIRCVLSPLLGNQRSYMIEYFPKQRYKASWSPLHPFTKSSLNKYQSSSPSGKHGHPVLLANHFNILRFRPQLRSSFSKAFGGGSGNNTDKKKKKNGSASDADMDSVSLRSEASVPNSPLLTIPHPMTAPSTPIKGSHSSSA
jgi:hypothetical protein